MKKTLVLLLIAAMLLSLCACGSRDVSGSVTPAEKETAAPTEEPAPAEEPAPTEEPAPAEEPAPTEEPAEGEDDVQLGTLSGGRYENAYLGLGCELSESWTIADEEQLASMIGLTASAIGGDYEQTILNADLFYDLYAESNEELATVNVIIQKLGLGAMLITEEQIIDASLESAKTQMEAAGFSDITMEKNTLTFAGKEHVGLKIAAIVQGVQLYEQQVYLLKGEHMAVITVGTYLSDRTADYCDLFYALS